MSGSYDHPLLLDEILSSQAQADDQVPLIAYPRDGTVADFELLTARDLNSLVERAAKHYATYALDPVEEGIVSLVGPSDLDHLITKFALSRLGFGVLLLSTRLSPEACLKLMRESKSHTIVQSESTLSFALGYRTQVLEESIQVIPLATGTVYRNADWDTKPFTFASRDRLQAQHQTAIVYHSSGSTGLPKSIATSHVKLLSPIPTGKGTRALTASPLCHAFASKLTINSMMVNKCMYLASASMPSTSNTLVEVLRAASPDVFLTVPYVLKLLAETQSGIHMLGQCKQVVSSGSTLSDELGDRLVQAGVNVETLFAGTEPGLVGTSMNRPQGDLAWDYIRLPPVIQQNTHYKPLGNNTFEFVYLETLPTLNMSNSDEPPGSFHSSDIFSPHSIIPHAWKYVGRIDDRVTLSTGEKVLPLPMEGKVREEPLVREAVVFGVDKDVPGLLVFRSDAAKDLSDDDLVNKIWPAVESANATSEAFGQISKDMVVCMPAGSFIPAADKESIIRAKVYDMYRLEIDTAYNELEEGFSGGVVLTTPELENFLLAMVRDEIGITLDDATTDFHRAGMDSLRAIRLRGLIMKRVSVDGTLSPNCVFDAGNVQALARKISFPKTTTVSTDDLSTGAEAKAVVSMQRLVDKFSAFSHEQTFHSSSETKVVVLLTGATGSLGAHLLSQLLDSSSVSLIYCLARGGDPAGRVRESLRSRGLPDDNFNEKAVIVEIDFKLSGLGVDTATLKDLRQNVSHIIHAAWPVNFQLGLESFLPQLQTVHDLLEMSLSNRRPRLLFCSSVSAAMNTPTPATILEAPIPCLSHAMSSGYAQSKLIGERIIEAAVVEHNADAKILRIGQVIGDTKHGIWNESEAWPLVIRSALTLEALPAFDMTCSWLPVDILASAILDATFSPSTPMVLNLENTRTFHWTRDLLPVLQKNRLSFEAVSPKIWLERLHQYYKNTSLEVSLKYNPAIKLIDYIEQLIIDQSNERLIFDTTKAQEYCPSLRQGSDVFVDGVLAKSMNTWLEAW